MKRRNVVVALTWLVVLWPLVQIILVEVALTNPWRLMGFAMYATEHEVKVTLRKQPIAGGPFVDVQSRDLPPEARDAYDDFVANRGVLGRLCSPASFVRTWRRVEPSLGGVDVEIEVLRLKQGRMTTIARDRVLL